MLMNKTNNENLEFKLTFCECILVNGFVGLISRSLHSAKTLQVLNTKRVAL